MTLNLNDLPPELIQFIQENELDPKEYMYKDTLPRYIRLNPHVDNQPSLEDLRIAFGPSVEPVEWFPAFYRMDASCRLSSSELHEKGVLILIESDAHLTKSEGKIYGMDIASAVAVNALSVKPNDQVLDLCCAPGGKLCYISDLQGPTSTGTVTGVDVTLHRLHVCKSVCKKYKLHKFRLFHADGTTFGVHAPSRFGGQSLLTHDLVENAKAWMFVKPFHSSRLLRTDAQLECDSLLYDKVLVDAECTTDGSISHLFMDAKSSVDWKTFEKVLDPEKLKGLKALQKGLISNGFKMLKTDGTLVYSTCSFSKKQNEDIVGWFLQDHPNAQLESIPDHQKYPIAPPVHPSAPFKQFQESIMEHTLRFSPSASKTSGLFIARFRKLGT